jgi:hypothetical protein
MKAFTRSWIIAFTAVAVAGRSYAQVPADNDRSDGNSNTGSGSFALRVRRLFALEPWSLAPRLQLSVGVP